MKFLMLMFKAGLFLLIIFGTIAGFYVGVKMVEQGIFAQDDYIYFVMTGLLGFTVTSIISGFGATIIKMEQDVEKLKQAIAVDDRSRE
ncbi:hypothetical protein [Fodinibius saliphilus]|uniref:hypothetical protein n=1 Tax=Fodinibius saliphilus TaxID=1920650 RepID=UPI001107C92F|nr:hypothetical protein [Fodinibius saliphilus]